MRAFPAARVGLVASAYAVFGWAGLLLAMPPDYATGVWLPSGIALAACLRYGRDAWPGVFLGALLVNLFNPALEPVSPAVRTSITALVASGSMLQALALAALVERREPRFRAFDAPSTMLRFALLWSPLGCLISASVGVASLVAFGQLDASRAAATWLTWWFGDLMGVVIVGPAALVLLRGAEGSSAGRRLLLATIGLVSFGLVSALHRLALAADPAVNWGGSAPQLVQAAGLLVTAMLMCVVLVVTGRAEQVQRLVAQRTGELAERNRRLSAEMAEREAVEARLRDTQRDFMDCLQFAQIGVWVYDVEQGLVTGTPEISQLYGLPPGSFRMEIGTVESLLHAGDRERVAEAMRSGIDAELEIAIDYRILRGDGQQRWVSTRARRRVDADGRVRLLGVTWDISDRVAAAARATLLTTAFEQGGEAIFIADADLGIVEVNPAFCELTGLTREEVIGRDVYDLFAERTSRPQFRAMVSAARERGHWQGEIWGRTRDGGASPQWLVLAAVRSDRGLLTNYIGSFVDISERKHAEAKIEFLAHHDPLTGLPNRFALQGRLEQALAQAARDQGRVAVMFIDMDRFKDINDSLGHDVGDLLLLEIARRLRASVRASDIVARLGGDEFVVVLTGVGDIEATAAMAAKLRQELAAPYSLRERLLHSSPSIGISLYPEHGDSVDVLTRNADAAMYRAKDLGRNNYQFFDVALGERARERIELAADLREALEQGAFLLHFQPQVRAADGRIVAAEALIRWRHPVRGMVPPDKFIGIAEEFGLIDAIGEWALSQACRDLAALNALGVRDFRVCVNLSPKQLRDRGLADKVAAALVAAGVAAESLELELTESVAMQDPQSTIVLLNQLYASGVGLAIDDFGTGYSSLSYLKMLPLHNLKLDRSFVRDIEVDASDRAICSATVALAHALGIKVVAEGVETEAQRDFLLALGCDYLQGWLFSKALPAVELADYVLAAQGGD